MVEKVRAGSTETDRWNRGRPLGWGGGVRNRRFRHLRQKVFGNRFDDYIIPGPYTLSELLSTYQ